MPWLPILLALALIVAFVLFARESLVPAEQAHALLRSGVLVIDVRSPEEFRQESLRGVVNLPLGDLPSLISARQPDLHRPVLVHCLSGTRSAMAVRTLRGLGYSSVFNLGSLERARTILGEARTRP